MKITVKVKTKCNTQEVKKIDDLTYLVKVKELPIDGKANRAVIKTLSDFFNTPKSNIILTSGQRSKIKTFLINSKPTIR